MNYYCFDCHKRFHMDEGISDIASCPFCQSESIDPDVEDSVNEEEEFDEEEEDDDLNDEDLDIDGDNGLDDDFDDEDPP